MKRYEFILKDLDCAACANEIQEKLAKNPELHNVNVNFAKLKLTYETDTVSVEEVRKAVKEQEPDVEMISAEKMKENMDTTTSESTENVTVETPEDVPEQGYATSGTYGENITWTFDNSRGILTFSGSGDMADTPAGEYTPWEKNFRTEVKHIIINEGITNIGMNAFYAIDQAVDISIPQSVTVIKKGGLQGCESITRLNLPNRLRSVGVDAFLFMDSCEGFYIDHPQTAYRTKDGVLFNDTTLLCYPQSKADVSYVIPYGTQIVESWSFTNPKYLTSVYIPETVVKTGGDSFANQHNKMVNPLTVVFNTTGKCQVDVGTFSHLPTRSKAMVKTQELYNQLVNETLKDNGTEGYVNTTTAEFYQQNNYDNYNAMKNMYNGVQRKVKSNEITLFGVHQDAATDCVTWKSSDPSVAAVVIPEAYMGDDIKDHIRYNEAETSSSGGYVKGGTKPGTATITVTREDKKDSFSFTVENVVPTTSEKLYYKDGAGYSQELRDSLCIYTGENKTVNVQTEPELTTALAGKVTWTSSDSSKVSIKVGGTYNEKATLYRKTRGDVTVTATMMDENGKVIEKTFCVTGYKTTYDWDISLDCDWIYVKDSTPVQPKVVVKDKGGTVLQEGRDYTLSYRDNYLPKGESSWTGYVCVFPIGEYTGANPEEEYFSIIMKNVTQTATNTKMPQWIWGIYQSSYDVSVGQSFTLKPEAKGKITYKTSNKKVATVNSKGKVTVKGTGKATITVTAKATSTYSKSVKKITVYGVPKKPEMKKLTAGKKKFTVQWKKDKKADGYQVQYSTDKKFKKNVKNVVIGKKQTTKQTIKKLKTGKKYYVRIRSYKKISGKKYYGTWSSKKTVKVK